MPLNPGLGSTSTLGMATVWILAAAVAMTAQRDRPQAGALAVGQEAPNFKLKALGKDEYFELKSMRGKRPVVLIFGSYT